MTALADGGFVVTWASGLQDGSGYGIAAQRYNANGTKFGNEFIVNTFTASEQYYATVTGLLDGGYLVTWESNGQNGGFDIYAQRYAADNSKVGSEFLINSTTTGDQIYPIVTSLNDGTVLFTWQSAAQDGSSWGVYSQKFVANILTNENASKTILGSTLLANDTDANGDTLTITAVSATSTNGAVVTLSNGDIVYDPTNATTIQALAAGQNLTDTFTYTVSDGNGGTSTATVSVVVLGVNQTLTGTASADQLVGGVGNDTITGGGGADRLTGGAGKDDFRYNATTEGGDTIVDFTSASDKIAILNSLVGTASTGTLDAAGKLGGTGAVLFESVSGNVAGTNASSKLIFDSLGKDLYFDSDGGDTISGRVLLAHLENGANIAATDIKIVA